MEFGRSDDDFWGGPIQRLLNPFQRALEVCVAKFVGSVEFRHVVDVKGSQGNALDGTLGDPRPTGENMLGRSKSRGENGRGKRVNRTGVQGSIFLCASIANGKSLGYGAMYHPLNVPHESSPRANWVR
jgi:hypothetical protein